MYGVPKIDVNFGAGMLGPQASPAKYHDTRGNSVSFDGVSIVRNGAFHSDGTPSIGTLTDPFTNVSTAPARTYMAQFKTEWDSGTGFKVIWGNTRVPASGWLMYVQRLAGGDQRMIGIHGGGAETFDVVTFRAGDQMTVFYIIDEATSRFDCVLNGVADTTEPLAGTYVTSAEPTLIGEAAGIGGFPFDGEIYRLMYWDHAMTTGQAQSLTSILQNNVINVDVT
jgi:hypothetical protein